MVFFNGTYTLEQLLALFKAQFATFDNFTIIDDAIDAYGSFVVKYNPENLYLLFWRSGWTVPSTDSRYDAGAYTRVNGMFRYKTDWECACGIGINIFTAWNATLHKGSGTTNRHFIPSIMDYAQDIAASWADARNPVSIQMWIDKYGFQGLIQKYYPTETRPVANGAFFTMEFVPYNYREVNDGLSDEFYHLSMCVDHSKTYPDENDKKYYHYNGRGASWCGNTDRIDQDKIKYAYKSDSNSEVYFEFPYWYSDTYMNKPIYQTRRWFYWNIYNQNIFPGDIITWNDIDKGVTRQFYCGLVYYPDGCSSPYRRLVAIPFSNAYQYV